MSILFLFNFFFIIIYCLENLNIPFLDFCSFQTLHGGGGGGALRVCVYGGGVGVEHCGGGGGTLYVLCAPSQAAVFGGFCRPPALILDMSPITVLILHVCTIAGLQP